MRRDDVIAAMLTTALLVGFVFGIGWCNVAAPCDVWKGSPVGQVPVRCVAELTR